MKPSVKFSMILIVTMIIGIAIGFEISEISIRNRFERPENFRRPDGFLKIWGDVIRPEKDQQPIVDSILLIYHTRIDQFLKNSFQEVTKQIDSMKIALSSVLNKEQMKRLEDEINRMGKHLPPNGRDMPPRDGFPGGMPPREGPPGSMPPREGLPGGMPPREGSPGDMQMRRDGQPNEMRREPPATDIKKNMPEKK
jgi:hypothetical protein